MRAPGGEVVITGGLGFIGSHLVDAYLAAGHRVRIIDSNAGAVIDGENYDADPRCAVIRERVEDYLTAGGDFTGVDRVIHAASYVGPASILSRAGRLGHDIIGSTAPVIEACMNAGAPLCMFSSAEVYGRSGVLDEKDDIVVPTQYNTRIEYAVAKTLAEAMVSNSRRHGLRGIVIRPFNVAGARQSRAGGFVMPTFVQQALAGRPITVFAGGDQVRAFIAAGDLTGFLTGYMDLALQGDEVIINVGNPANAVTIMDLAERVKSLLASPSPIVRVDGRSVHGPHYAEAESFHKIPALRTATDLGWRPRIPLDELILTTADYYRAREDRRAVNAPL
ncbi:NAD-dependent epimerase/dehydratase family protein [Nonomuraea sp. KC401]|uniref:NAD-dependent epimerase/dehydratase family protein n=1 Tax=unclassified Nonomuraea TaxID=2593643 RepID=UPI0010FE5374|nr:NAD-dependent epimerase/dehydratase family protein [Nonomuraea sp. KC401]NBE98290.1 NAD-dependent epimerase/dehydratase family protein [Nonomuraea sp. K271]TLF54799.1 NAD-dependent epimerase/dehydratase family protein [Nonomuraea sp. KC401]